MRRLAHQPNQSRRHRIDVMALLVVLLSALALNACGSGTSSQPVSSAPMLSAHPEVASPTPVLSGGGAFDACTLITTVELKLILAEDAVQAQPIPGGGWVAGQCAWNGLTSGFVISVGTAASISAFGDPVGADAKAKLAQFKSAPGVSQDIAGIGDGAVLRSIGIAAYRDTTYVEVTNVGLTESQLVEVAKLAVAKL